MSSNMVVMTQNVQGMQRSTQQLNQHIAYMGQDVNRMSGEVAPTMQGMRAFMPWEW